MIFSGIPYALRISAIIPRCMESKALEKSIKRSVAVRLFSFTPSMILLTVSIWPVVDLLVLKPFWFFLNILFTSGLILFKSIILYIFAAIHVRVIPR